MRTFNEEVATIRQLLRETMPLGHPDLLAVARREVIANAERYADDDRPLPEDVSARGVDRWVQDQGLAFSSIYVKYLRDAMICAGMAAEHMGSDPATLGDAVIRVDLGPWGMQ